METKQITELEYAALESGNPVPDPHWPTDRTIIESARHVECAGGIQIEEMEVRATDVSANGRQISLTEQQFGMLRILIAEPHDAFSRGELARKLEVKDEREIPRIATELRFALGLGWRYVFNSANGYILMYSGI